MTYNDIFTKFLIEYDKAEFSSSYPSLTDYEIATILDKAYLALIAEKVTGTNFRKAPIEGDRKAIEDIRPLITRTVRHELTTTSPIAENEHVYTLPDGFMYYIEGNVDFIEKQTAIDELKHTALPAALVSHEVAQTYKTSATNLPWIQSAVTYLEDNRLHVLVDQYTYNNNKGTLDYTLIYVKEPTKFIKSDDTVNKTSTFQLSDTMAEELINLAIIMSLEIVESTRLTSKTNIAALES